MKLSTFVPSPLTTPPGLVLIDVKNPVNVATSEITGISSSYDALQIVFQNVVPVAATDELLIQYGTGGGPTYVTSGYADPNGTTANGFGFVDLGTTKILADRFAGSAVITGVQLNPNTYNLSISGLGNFWNGTKIFPSFICGAVSPGATPVTAIRIKFVSANIATGRWWLYGFKKA